MAVIETFGIPRLFPETQDLDDEITVFIDQMLAVPAILLVSISFQDRREWGIYVILERSPTPKVFGQRIEKHGNEQPNDVLFMATGLVRSFSHTEPQIVRKGFVVP